MPVNEGVVEGSVEEDGETEREPLGQAEEERVTPPPPTQDGVIPGDWEGIPEEGLGFPGVRVGGSPLALGVRVARAVEEADMESVGEGEWVGVGAVEAVADMESVELGESVGALEREEERVGREVQVEVGVTRKGVGVALCVVTPPSPPPPSDAVALAEVEGLASRLFEGELVTELETVEEAVVPGEEEYEEVMEPV